MKSLRLPLLIVLGAGLGIHLAAQTQPAAAPTPAAPGKSASAAPAAKQPAAKATPGKPAPAATKQPDAKAGKAASAAKGAAKQEEATIPGQVINRGDGTFMSLSLQGTNFRLTFYDENKKQMKANVTRATARWPNPRAPGDNRTVLNPTGDGMALVGAKPVLPPFNFNVFLTLLQGEGDTATAVGTFTVKFTGGS